ncbi:gp53-like domain-containing protein [Acinetobacter faecalis]|uniref:gp53-like domain-containing protein n=1 Tax=Acinetobacter faecalis TaxID=2665161 RepID=UPI002A9207C4|nr:hypothetical protein [Acinetobacter faecalis]MDY6450723.1 hypothetical protein [Acinetobacter faecalis]
MSIEKLEEFARDGQKNTDELILTDGFPRPKFPARQWFNYLFNMLSLKINEIIELDPIARSEIVDNLTTNDANKVASARAVKELQDNKLEAKDIKNASTTQKGIVQLVDDLTTGGTETVVTAEAIKSFYQMFSGGSSRFRIPNPLEPDKPWIIQFFNTPSSAANAETNFIQNFPVAFPNKCTFVIASDYQDAFVSINTMGLLLSTYGKTKTGVGIIWDAVSAGSQPTSRSASIIAIGN